MHASEKPAASLSPSSLLPISFTSLGKFEVQSWSDWGVALHPYFPDHPPQTNDPLSSSAPFLAIDRHYGKSNYVLTVADSGLLHRS